jgi:hypothetical protein
VNIDIEINKELLKLPPEERNAFIKGANFVIKNAIKQVKEAK